MPKRKFGGRKSKKKPPRNPTLVTAPVWEGQDGESGSESDGDLGQERLEGLEVEDMEMISRMGLNVSEDVGKKRHKKEPAVSQVEFGGDTMKGGRRAKRKREMVTDSEEGEEDEGGASWEGVRKGGGGEDEVHYLLPLKTRGGLVLQPPVPKPNTPDGDGNRFSEEEGENGEVEEQQPRTPSHDAVPECLSTAALLARREVVLQEKKETIADIASSLVENPEENISSVQRLLTLCHEREAQVACTVRRMAMASLTTVFKDIAPSYHIRELSEAEKATKVSKDVRKLRVFEETLLSVYQRYLTLLDDYITVGLGESNLGGGEQVKRKKESKKPLDVLDDDQTLSQASMQALGEVALRCMCELLVGLPHFNFRNNILVAIVPRMASKALGGKISRLCCETIERLFRDDIIGDISLEAVRLISKLIKSKSYNTKPAVLRSFLHLQLRSVDEPVGSVGGRTKGGKGASGSGEKHETAITGRGSQLTRKQRKRLKAERELNRDMKETEATESREKKNKLQTEVLQLVFATYFRILKNSRHSPLLQPVLEGLAKFAHLISIDFFSDLMSVLHTLAESGGLTNKECMLCVLTAFEILSGQGEALNIDPRQFYIQLYEALLQLDTVSSNNDVILALDCMDKMMRKRRQVSLQRVLGFVKRLSTISLQLVPGACLAVLSTVRKCMLAYSQCEQLLDPDSACGGVFRPDIVDPEMSQAGSTLLWELTVYSRHYCPALRGYATHLLHGAPTQGKQALNPEIAKRTAGELAASLSYHTAMSTAPDPPVHPATKLAHKNRDYYYKDCGIRDDVIRKLEQEAIRDAERANIFELTDRTLE